MSWAGHLKSLVLEADPTPAPPVKVTMVPTPGAAMVFHPAEQAMVFAPAADTGFLVKLNQKIALPGTPADKFEKTLASLAGIPDESLRLTSALNVLRDTGGIDIQALIADYSQRGQALDREVTQFTSAIAAQRKSELDEPQARLARTCHTARKR